MRSQISKYSHEHSEGVSSYKRMLFRELQLLKPKTVILFTIKCSQLSEDEFLVKITENRTVINKTESTAVIDFNEHGFLVFDRVKFVC